MHKSLLVLAATALFAAACGAAAPPASATTDTTVPQGKKVDPATAGSVSGKVTLTGPAPAPEMMRVAVDQTCIQAMGTMAKSDAILVGADGAIQNAFVYIKDPLTEYTFDTPSTPVVLDQKGCRYSPRVFGVRVGQPLEMINSDATLHNVHAMPNANSQFNEGQPVQGMVSTKKFDKAEMTPFKIKCDVHGWMKSYMIVLPHPYHAVSGMNGQFTIPNLPPGTYTIEAWHEKYGKQEQNITVGAKEQKQVNFTFKG